MTFKSLVEEHMAEGGLSVHGLAKKAEVDTGNLWRLLHDPARKRVTLETALKIMRALNIPLTELERVEK